MQPWRATCIYPQGKKVCRERKRKLEGLQQTKSLAFFFFFFFFFFCLFWCSTHGIWRFPGQGWNRSCSHRPMAEPQQCQIQATYLYHSSWQCQRLNPLSKAKDRTHNLMVPGQIHKPLSHDRNSLNRLFLKSSFLFCFVF